MTALVILIDLHVGKCQPRRLSLVCLCQINIVNNNLIPIIFEVPAPAVEGNEEGASTSCSTETSKSNNLVRIQQRKQQVYNWPRNKKILKLAIYSHCQVI